MVLGGESMGKEMGDSSSLLSGLYVDRENTRRSCLDFDLEEIILICKLACCRTCGRDDRKNRVVVMGLSEMVFILIAIIVGRRRVSRVRRYIHRGREVLRNSAATHI